MNEPEQPLAVSIPFLPTKISRCTNAKCPESSNCLRHLVAKSEQYRARVVYTYRNENQCEDYIPHQKSHQTNQPNTHNNG